MLAAAPIQIGGRIGPYEIREHLGDGGMAVVYKVWHTGLQRFEALKVPHYQATFGPESEFVQRLLSEARMAAGLHHPHIVAIHNVSEADASEQYFAMEFVDGQDLQKLLKTRERLPLAETITILRQVAEALDYAHANNVVHRDVKPANILLQKDGERVVAKVVDFGISRAGEDEACTRMTGSGVYIGTPEYMSPEQSGSGDRVDRRTDVYSLGIVAYEMLLGLPPFVAEEGVNRISIIVRHVNSAPRAPVEIDPTMKRSVNDAILRALQKRPSDRFETCSDFVDALRGEAALGLARERRGAGTGLSPSSNWAADGDRRGTRLLLPTSAGTTMMAAEPLETSVASGLRRTMHNKTALRRSTVLAGLGGLVAGCTLIYGATGRLARPVLTSAPPQVVAAAAPVQAVSGGGAIAEAATANITRTSRVHQSIALPYPTHWRDSANLPVGQRKIVQKGQAGQRELVQDVRYKNGIEQDRRTVLDHLVKAPQPEIQLIGTAVAGSPHAATMAHPTSPRPRTLLAQTVVRHHVASYSTRQQYRARVHYVSDSRPFYRDPPHFADTPASQHHHAEDDWGGPMTYVGVR